MGEASQVTLRNCSKGARAEPRYIGVFVVGEVGGECRYQSSITANHKSWTSQANNDFSAFLCLIRCRSLGSLRLFLRWRGI